MALSSACMQRRAFFFSPALSALALQPAPASGPADEATNPPGLEYFILGNGLILAAVQSVSAPGAATQAGVVLMSPEHLNRKPGSLLYHPRSGLQLTRCMLLVDDQSFYPQPGGANAGWQYPGGIPSIRIQWNAGPCRVTEFLFCLEGEPALIRDVVVENTAAVPVRAAARATLRPNPLLFDEYEIDREHSRLRASGYHRLELSGSGGRALDREIETSFGLLQPAARASTRFILSLDRPGAPPDQPPVERASASTAQFWNRTASLQSGDAALDRMFHASAHVIRSVTAASGKLDGGLWGYNLEWVRDAAMAASAAVLAGLPEIGEAILDRILTRMISENGAALDSSFHRPAETIELDQNGQLLYVLWTHWAWTGSDALIRKHWLRIRAVADFSLDLKFRHPRTGLVGNSREFWERSTAHGVLNGYELAYQAWNIAGWERAADFARLMDDEAGASRWLAAAALMKRSFLTDPVYSFIEDGRFIKRRLASGQHQTTLQPPDRGALPPGMPLSVAPVSYCDPDASCVFPMLLGIVDPRGDVARNTLQAMESLWNQHWEGGGYGRYDVSGEPDSPGPWPFATLFIARAWLEAGDSAKVSRALRWLASVPGGRAGAWFEYYGPRPVPPLPPVAVVPWTSAELITLTVHHLLGVRPDPRGLTVRPMLLDGMNEVSAVLRLNGCRLKLDIRRTGRPSAAIDGRKAEMQAGSLRTGRPSGDMSIEIRI